MNRRLFATLFLLISLSAWVEAQEWAPHQKVLTSGWQFVKTDLGGIWEALRIPQAGQPTNFPIWETVELPHCVNALDAVDPKQNYYQGPAWYRTVLDIENPYRNGRTFLRFEGAGQKTDVYVGLTLAGSHEGGYDVWQIDITDAVAETQKNTYIQKNYNGKIPVSIRTDNSRDLELIPSDLSDFHIYGGIYRPLYLVHRPERWVESLKIQASVDSKGKQGQLNIQLQGERLPLQADFKLKIVDPTGKTVATQTINSNDQSFTLSIAKPALWSPNAPNLYTAQVEVQRNGEPSQMISSSFGFRHFEFHEQGPFYLNGERLLLKGTHRHEDFAGVGAAETEVLLLSEMIQMKAMGANFIRLGHYQQANRVLELCDSLGLLVWEEIPWCRGGLGGETYKTQARSMLHNMIEQHFNHPSVILWGLGNENDWPGDFETFEPDSIRAFMAELHELAHQLDNSRLTSIRRCEFCKDVVDVYSPSIWPGWYRGRYTDYYRATQFEKEHTTRFLHVEWGADSHVGRHSEIENESWKTYNPHETIAPETPLNQLYSTGKNMSKEGDWSETYAAELFDWTLTEQKRMPWLSGTAIWTFKDFATPIRPENPIPYVNQKGVAQRDLTPKEAFYVVQAHWSEQPMIHIYGHSWPIRSGQKGELKTVKVFSNCDEVELLLNGKSLGTKKRNPNQFPAMGLTWELTLNEGRNTLKATGKTKGQTLTDELEWNYQIGSWGPVDKLVLTEEPIDEQSSFLKVTAVDAAGKMCLDAANTVEFAVLGHAQLHAMQGTATGSHVIQLANGQAKIKLLKTGDFYSAAVWTEGLGWFPIHKNSNSHKNSK